MNVLSLFDGISCAMVALERAGIPVNKYYACEIEKNAMKVSKKNYPDIISLGSVIDFNKDMIKEPIDLLVGGSPCQDLSIAKKERKGLEGDRSSLFFEYVRIKNEMKPKYFILENVASMKKEDKDIISGIMGCEPVMFNASLVSAQTRKRYFWTNIKFDLPEDRGILLKDILQPDAEVDERMLNKEGKSYVLTSSYSKVSNSEAQVKNSVEKKQRTMVKVGHIGTSEPKPKLHKNFMAKDGKALCLTLGYNQVSVSQNEINRCMTGVYKNNYVFKDGAEIEDDTEIKPSHIRKLTPIECERLQSLPDNYTEGIAMTNRYKCLGNAFNVEVVAHILKHI
jgi:DNA (cytosine-5)-methyltransferase 3A